MAENLPLWGGPLRTLTMPRALPLRTLALPWALPCFRPGALQSLLPSPMCISSASRHSSSSRMVIMFVPAIQSTCFYLIGNGSSVILARKTYPFVVQWLGILRTPCTTWSAHMGILSSPVMITASLSMCWLVPR